MPTYEYICKDCGHTFEIVRSMKDDALTVCPECGGTLRKVFGAPAISFKGSGFYATDHGRKARAGGDKGDTGEKEKKTSSTTDTKSGTRTDTKDGGSSGSSRGSSSQGPSGGSKDGSSSGGSKESSSSGGSKESSSS